jgi:transcription elongation factor Elf1
MMNTTMTGPVRQTVNQSENQVVCPVCSCPLEVCLTQARLHLNVLCEECGATLELDSKEPITLVAVHEPVLAVAEVGSANWRDWR